MSPQEMESKIPDINLEGEICPICLMKYLEHKKIIVFYPCPHSMCFQCFKQYLEHNFFNNIEDIMNKDTFTPFKWPVCRQLIRRHILLEDRLTITDKQRKEYLKMQRVMDPNYKLDIQEKIVSTSRHIISMFDPPVYFPV